MNDSLARFKENGAYLVVDGPCSTDQLKKFVQEAKEQRIIRFDARTLWLWLADKGINSDAVKIGIYLRRLHDEGRLENVGIRITDSRVGTKKVYEIIQ